MNAQAQLDAFIDRYSPKVAADARRAIGFLSDRLPTAARLVYDNYNALVVGFGPTHRASEAILSIAVYPKYVRLFFLKGTTLLDPHGLLEGKGSQVRSVQLLPIARLETPEVSALIEAAVANGSPLPLSGQGALLIRAISAKQRPRRPA